MAVPTPRNTEAKLQHILRVSAETFATHGFEGTSMRDISKATEVSLSGLYYYFDSKQRLLYFIQRNAFSFIVERLQEKLAGSIDAVARLRILVQNHIDYFLSHPNEMKVLSHEEEALQDPFRQEIGTIKRKYFALARKIFEEIAREAPNPGLNERVAVLSLFGMMNWVYQWHKPGVDPGADNLTDMIVGIFLYGVTGANGGKFMDLSGRVVDAVHSE